MTTDTLALAFAGASILMALPGAVWLFLWGVRR